MDAPDFPIFIVGSARSGTTLLRLMLNRHPRVHIPRESWFLTDLMDALPLDVELSDEQKATAFQIITAHFRWKDWEIPDESLREEFALRAKSRLSDLVAAAFELSRRRAGKPRWADKTPPYVLEIDRLRKLFPTAKFIHVVRDGHDVCISLDKVDWPELADATGVKFITDYANYWSKQVLAGAGAGRKLGSDVYIEVHYEDLVLDSEKTLQQVCEFIREDYNPVMLEFHQTAKQEIAAWELPVQQKLARAPRASDTYRWHNEMATTQILIAEAIAGRALDTFGYERKYKGIRKMMPALVLVLYRLYLGLNRILSKAGLKTPSIRRIIKYLGLRN